MRIAIVAGPHVPIPPAKYGGSEQVIKNLIQGLLEHGHEPILLASGDSKVDCELVPIVDKAIFFPPTRAAIPEFRKLEAKLSKRTASVLSKLLPRIDIIHSHGFDLTNFSHFPNLTTLHSTPRLPDIAAFVKNNNLNYVTISKNQRRAVPQLNIVRTVYNGEDPVEHPFTAKPNDYVCFMGRLDRDKNPHVAIQLAIGLGLKIKLAGKTDFDSEGYFEEEIEPLLGHPLVEYFGEVTPEEKIQILSNARCNLHPVAFREPFGLTVLEAAFCGTPTLAVNRGSMSEVIEDGKTGILVEDFIEGYHKLEKCFKLNRKYTSDRARRLFNHKVMTKNYIRAYNSVLKSSG